jgi:SAM-dependent methyltransferase
MKDAPFPDGSYAGIVALGSIEHTAEGPHKILKEFHRLLRPDGVAIITIPFGGRLRILLRNLSKPLLLLKSWAFVRKLFSRPVSGTRLHQARKATKHKWHPRFAYGPEGWFFYEYEFSKCHMRAFFAEARLDVLEEFVEFGNEGIFHNFGRLAGKWNEERADVDFTTIGLILKKILPVEMVGHMLCYVVAKRASNDQDADHGL